MNKPDQTQRPRQWHIIFLTILAFLSLYMTACKTPTDVATGKPGKKLTQSEQLQLTALFIDANREKALGNSDKALGLFAQCIKRDPTYAPAMYEMARIFESNNQLNEARSLAINAVKYESNNEWYQLLLAGIHIKMREYTDAAKLLKALADKHTETPDYSTDLANVYILAGKYAEAIKVYDDVERNFGVSEEICLEKERLYLQLGKIKPAIDEVKKLVEAFPGEVKYMGILAELYLSSGDELKGLDLYQKIIDIDPSDPYVHLSLADYYRVRKNEQKSFEELSLAFSNPNLDIDKKIRILLNYFDRASYDSIAKVRGYALCKLTTEAHPDEAKAWSMYGDFFYSDNRYAEAADAFRKVISIDSSRYAVWSQLLIIDSKLGDVTILENESRRAMELFPEQAEPYLYNGFANTKLKNYQPALKALRTGLAFTYESEMIEKFQSNLGDLLYDMKRYDEAFEAYERALKENPNNTYVLEKYTTGLIEQKQNYIRAIEMSRTLYDLDSDNLKYKDLYATALFLSGEQEQAKIYWDQILKGDTQPPATVYEHYGDLMFKMNNVEAAVEYWKRAKDAGLVSEKLDRKINDRKLYE